MRRHSVFIGTQPRPVNQQLKHPRDLASKQPAFPRKKRDDHLGLVLGLLVIPFGITATGVWYARQSSYHEQHKALVAQYAGFLQEWDAAHLAPFSAIGFSVAVQGDGDTGNNLSWALQRSSKPTKRAKSRSAPGSSQQNAESASVMFTAQLAVAGMYRSALGESASKQQQKPQPQLTVSHVKQWAAQTLGQSQQSLPEGDAGQLEAAPDVSDTEEQEDAAPSTASRSGAQASNTATLSLLQPQQYHLRVQQGVNQRRQPGEQAAAQEYEIELGQYSFLRVRNIKARSENLCTRGRGGLWDAGARTCTVLEYLSALCFKVQLDGGHYRLDYTHGGVGCDAGHDWDPAAYKAVRLSGKRGEKKAVAGANSTDRAVFLPAAAASAPTLVIRHMLDPELREQAALHLMKKPMQRVMTAHAIGVAITFLGGCASVATAFALVTIVRKRLGWNGRVADADGQVQEEEEDDE